MSMARQALRSTGPWSFSDELRQKAAVDLDEEIGRLMEDSAHSRFWFDRSSAPQPAGALCLAPGVYRRRRT